MVRQKTFNLFKVVFVKYIKNISDEYAVSKTMKTMKSGRQIS